MVILVCLLFIFCVYSKIPIYCGSNHAILAVDNTYCVLSDDQKDSPISGGNGVFFSLNDAFDAMEGSRYRVYLSGGTHYLSKGLTVPFGVKVEIFPFEEEDVFVSDEKAVSTLLSETDNPCTPSCSFNIEGEFSISLTGVETITFQQRMYPSLFHINTDLLASFTGVNFDLKNARVEDCRDECTTYTNIQAFNVVRVETNMIVEYSKIGHLAGTSFNIHSYTAFRFELGVGAYDSTVNIKYNKITLYGPVVNAIYKNIYIAVYTKTVVMEGNYIGNYHQILPIVRLHGWELLFINNIADPQGSNPHEYFRITGSDYHAGVSDSHKILLNTFNCNQETAIVNWRGYSFGEVKHYQMNTFYVVGNLFNNCDESKVYVSLNDDGTYSDINQECQSVCEITLNRHNTGINGMFELPLPITSATVALNTNTVGTIDFFADNADRETGDYFEPLDDFRVDMSTYVGGGVDFKESTRTVLTSTSVGALEYFADTALCTDYLGNVVGYKRGANCECREPIVGGGDCSTCDSGYTSSGAGFSSCDIDCVDFMSENNYEVGDGDLKYDVVDGCYVDCDGGVDHDLVKNSECSGGFFSCLDYYVLYDSVECGYDCSDWLSEMNINLAISVLPYILSYDEIAEECEVNCGGTYLKRNQWCDGGVVKCQDFYFLDGADCVDCTDEHTQYPVDNLCRADDNSKCERGHFKTLTPGVCDIDCIAVFEGADITCESPAVISYGGGNCLCNGEVFSTGQKYDNVNYECSDGYYYNSNVSPGTAGVYECNPYYPCAFFSSSGTGCAIPYGNVGADCDATCTGTYEYCQCTAAGCAGVNCQCSDGYYENDCGTYCNVDNTESYGGGVCTCDLGFDTLSDCDTTLTCPLDCNNGECIFDIGQVPKCQCYENYDASDDCLCRKGYEGADCITPKECLPTTNCGNGECAIMGGGFAGGFELCICEDGYEGAGCLVPICAEGCEFGCSEPGGCNCDDGFPDLYDGEACKDPVCSMECGAGICVDSPSFCQCKSGFATLSDEDIYCSNNVHSSIFANNNPFNKIFSPYLLSFYTHGNTPRRRSLESSGITAIRDVCTNEYNGILIDQDYNIFVWGDYFDIDYIPKFTDGNELISVDTTTITDYFGKAIRVECTYSGMFVMTQDGDNKYLYGLGRNYNSEMQGGKKTGFEQITFGTTNRLFDFQTSYHTLYVVSEETVVMGGENAQKVLSIGENPHGCLGAGINDDDSGGDFVEVVLPLDVPTYLPPDDVIIPKIHAFWEGVMFIYDNEHLYFSGGEHPSTGDEEVNVPTTVKFSDSGLLSEMKDSDEIDFVDRIIGGCLYFVSGKKLFVSGYKDYDDDLHCNSGRGVKANNGFSQPFEFSKPQYGSYFAMEKYREKIYDFDCKYSCLIITEENIYLFGNSALFETVDCIDDDDCSTIQNATKEIMYAEQGYGKYYVNGGVASDGYDVLTIEKPTPYNTYDDMETYVYSPSLEEGSGIENDVLTVILKKPYVFMEMEPEISWLDISDPTNHIKPAGIEPLCLFPVPDLSEWEWWMQEDDDGQIYDYYKLTKSWGDHRIDCVWWKAEETERRATTYEVYYNRLVFDQFYYRGMEAGESVIRKESFFFDLKIRFPKTIFGVEIKVKQVGIDEYFDAYITEKSLDRDTRTGWLRFTTIMKYPNYLEDVELATPKNLVNALDVFFKDWEIVETVAKSSDGNYYHQFFEITFGLLTHKAVCFVPLHSLPVSWTQQCDSSIDHPDCIKPSGVDIDLDMTITIDNLCGGELSEDIITDYVLELFLDYAYLNPVPEEGYEFDIDDWLYFRASINHVPKVSLLSTELETVELISTDFPTNTLYNSAITASGDACGFVIDTFEEVLTVGFHFRVVNELFFLQPDDVVTFDVSVELKITYEGNRRRDIGFGALYTSKSYRIKIRPQQEDSFNVLPYLMVFGGIGFVALSFTLLFFCAATVVFRSYCKTKVVGTKSKKYLIGVSVAVEEEEKLEKERIPDFEKKKKRKVTFSDTIRIYED